MIALRTLRCFLVEQEVQVEKLMLERQDSPEFQCQFKGQRTRSSAVYFVQSRAIIVKIVALY